MFRHSTIAARVTMTLLRVTIAIPLLLMNVALPARFVRAADAVQPSEEDPFSEAVRNLYQAENTFPPSAISLPPDVPPAPHLEDCEARTAFRLSTEKWGERGEPPYWAVPNPACGNVPQPPWIRGSDAANLAATRQAQADIWRQQFPPRQCKGRRVMVVEWLSMGWHGIGSQLHVMGAVLSAALLHNRTLVLMPATLPQADHAECERGRLTATSFGSPPKSHLTCRALLLFLLPSAHPELGRRGSLECYFFRFSSQECEEIALKARQAWKAAEERKQQAAAEEKEREERERGEKEREENDKGEEQAPGGGGGSGKGGERDSKEEGGEKVKNGGGRRLLQAAIETGDVEVFHADVVHTQVSHADNTTDGADGTGDNNEESKRDVTNEDVIVAEPCDGVGCLGSDALVIFPATPGFGVDGGSNFISQLNASAADLWGKAYLKSPLPNEVMGRMGEHSRFLKKAHWWRAQATRFMLRWPSAYLCHIINRERHHVYGMHVARQVVASRMDQTSLLAEFRRSGRGSEEVKRDVGKKSEVHSRMDQRSLLAESWGSSKVTKERQELGGSDEASEEMGGAWVEGRDGTTSYEERHGLKSRDKSPVLGNATGAANSSRSSSSSSSSTSSRSGGLGDLEGEQYGWDPYLANYEGVGAELYVPRPIVSVHVRQGDKSIEMRLFSFYAVMFMANRIRRGFPTVRYAWLSTEMQVGENGEGGSDEVRRGGGVSSHVRGGWGLHHRDMAFEMRRLSFHALMFMANRTEMKVRGRGEEEIAGCRGWEKCRKGGRRGLISFHAVIFMAYWVRRGFPAVGYA
ncbi:unnamed protein product [Closterium sp. NIES-64]|nr:unnamed protein product [Closterium sp. NIES-64]